MQKRSQQKEHDSNKELHWYHLQFKEKYYKVCNTDLTDSFNNNDEVNASFTKIEECKAFEDLIICALAFEFEDIIDVTKIE